jgi:hypothetical protein
VLKTNKLRLLAVRSATTVTSLRDILNDDNGIFLYPNPSNGLFNIESAKELGEVMIINNLGQIIYSVNSKEKRISLSQLQKGIYHIHINSDHQRVVKRLQIY